VRHGEADADDWSVLRDRADIGVFQHHLPDPEAVIESDCEDDPAEWAALDEVTQSIRRFS
jgi:hypothetical protein